MLAEVSLLIRNHAVNKLVRHLLRFGQIVHLAILKGQKQRLVFVSFLHDLLVYREVLDKLLSRRLSVPLGT